MDDEAREAVRARFVLAGLEAEVLQDDPEVRNQFNRLKELLDGWKVAGEQAVAVHLRLLKPEPHPGYTEQDLIQALEDYRNARGWVLAAIDQIAQEHR